MGPPQQPPLSPGAPRLDSLVEVVGVGRTPPPGFTSSLSAAAAAEQHGAVLRRAGGTYSAPPPPGFGATPDQRGAMGAPSMDRGVGSGGGGVDSGVLGMLHPSRYALSQPQQQRLRQPQQQQQHHPALLRPSEIMGEGMAAAADAGEGEDHQKRTTSFANLAAALGEGLAESMESSLERQRSDRQHASLTQATSVLSVGSRQQHPSRNGSSLFAASTSPVPERGPDGISNGGHAAAAAVRLSEHHPLDYSSGSGIAVVAAVPRMASAPLPKDRPTPSTVAETAPSPSFSMHSSRSTPLSLYPPPSSLNPSPAPASRAHNGHVIGVMAEEPRSGAASPVLPTSSMKGLSLSGHAPGAATTAIPAPALPHRSSLAMDGKSHSPGHHAQPSSGNGTHRGGEYPGSHGMDATRDGMRAEGTAYARGSPNPPSPGLDRLQQHQHQLQHQQHPDNNLGRAVLPPPSSAAEPSLSQQLGGGPAAAADPSSPRSRVEQELAPFIWEASGGPAANGARTPSPPSNRTGRGLVILGASGLHAPDVRSTCEAFGALLSFRHEFRESRGVVFLSYHDLRSARYSAMELASCLEKLCAPASHADNGGEGEGRRRGAGFVKVRYCAALNSSSANDESMIVLGNMPPNVDEEGLKQMMTSYGAVRSVRLDEMDETCSSFVVEFYDIQDARQALSELESSHPWGLDVTVEVGTRHPAERKQGQDLLALLGRWRHGENSSSSEEKRNSPAVRSVDTIAPSPSASSDSTSPMPNAPDTSIPLGASASNPGGIAVPGPGAAAASMPANAPPMQQQPTTQLMIGPDGNYTYVVVNPAAVSIPQHHVQHPQVAHMRPFVHQQHIVHGPHGTYVTSMPAPPPQVHHHHPGQQQYIIHHSPPALHHHPAHHAHAMPQYHHLPPGTVLSAAHPYVGVGAAAHGAMPVYAPAATSPHGNGNGMHGAGQPYVLHAHHPSGGDAVTAAAVVGGGGPNGNGNSGGGLAGHRRTTGGGGAPRAATTSEEAAQLLLSIDAVKNGADGRTSLMVRNIPNKYTQQMLLSEFAEGGHGPDKIDFFYLPIDFKNRCNRGYAFVNFVDHRDIVSFHERYNGRRWKVFNSDKICDITYARIQGKAAMMKRFQNSALMEKDDEYKPLVFISHGADKGKREEFPVAEPPQPPSAVSSLAAAAKGMHSPPR